MFRGLIKTYKKWRETKTFYVTLTLKVCAYIHHLIRYEDEDEDNIYIILKELRKISSYWHLKRDVGVYTVLGDTRYEIELTGTFYIRARKEKEVREKLNNYLLRIKDRIQFYKSTLWNQKIYIERGQNEKESNTRTT